MTEETGGFAARPGADAANPAQAPTETAAALAQARLFPYIPAP